MSGSEPQYPLIDRLYLIVRFWEDAYEIRCIHVSRGMHRALSAERRGAWVDTTDNMMMFMGYRIGYCDLDGCTSSCFSVVLGKPLPVVGDTHTITMDRAMDNDLLPEGLIWE